ncbi:MAG: hypothetical protein V3V10_08270 [Planctomycetota bacterium]
MIAKTVSRGLLTSVLFLCLSAPALMAQDGGLELSDTDKTAIRGKLTEAGVKKDRADLLLAKVSTDREAAVFSNDGKIIALNASSLSKAGNETLAAKMNAGKLKAMELKVTLTALLFGMLSKYPAEDFPSRELLKPALALNGFELSGDLKPDDYSRESAIGDSAVWAYTAVNSDAVTKFKSDLPDVKAVKGLYAQALVKATIAARANRKMELAIEYGKQAVGRSAELNVEFVLSYLEAIRVVVENDDEEESDYRVVKSVLEALGPKFFSEALENQMDNVRILNLAAYGQSEFDVTPHNVAILKALQGFHDAKEYAGAKPILESFDDAMKFTPLMSLYAAKCFLEVDSKDAAKNLLSKLFVDGVELTLDEWLLAGHVANKLGMDEKASAAVQKAYELSSKK